MGQITSRCYEDSSTILNDKARDVIEPFTPPRNVILIPRNSLKSKPNKFPNISSNNPSRLSTEVSHLEVTSNNYNIDHNTNKINNNDNNNKYIILFDFAAEKSKELSVTANQIVEIVSINEDIATTTATTTDSSIDYQDYSYVKLIHGNISYQKYLVI